MALIIRQAPLFRPRYSADGGGSLTDGQPATITGTGFGTNSATQVSLKEHIEAASAGTNLYDIAALSSSGWGNAEGVEGTGRRTQISTASKVYGTKGLACDNPTDGRFGVKWNTGGTVTDMFFRDYARLDTNSVTGGQWKMLRWNNDGGVQDIAVCNMYIAARQSLGFGGDFYIVNETQGVATDAHYNIDFNGWYEREFRIVPGTQGGSNGRFEQRIWRLSDGALVGNETFTDVPNYASGQANRITHLVIHNFQGNGDFGDGSHPTVVYMDGTYITNGNQKRIYLADKSTWAAAITTGGKKEIQPWTNWSDTSLTITVRKGQLADLTSVWGYVVDSSGNVNANGYTVTP